MSRPIYETKEHLKNQEQVKDYIEQAWGGCTLKKLPHKDVLDYAVCQDGNIKAWVEIKCRKQEFTTSLNLMIGMFKIHKGRELSKETGLPFFLVVRFNSDIYYYKDRGEKHSLMWAGRIKTQRDDQDQEPCYFIDIGLFKKL